MSLADDQHQQEQEQEPSPVTNDTTSIISVEEKIKELYGIVTEELIQIFSWKTNHDGGFTSLMKNESINQRYKTIAELNDMLSITVQQSIDECFIWFLDTNDERFLSIADVFLYYLMDVAKQSVEWEHNNHNVHVANAKDYSSVLWNAVRALNGKTLHLYGTVTPLKYHHRGPLKYHNREFVFPLEYPLERSVKRVLGSIEFIMEHPILRHSVNFLSGRVRCRDMMSAWHLAFICEKIPYEFFKKHFMNDDILHNVLDPQALVVMTNYSCDSEEIPSVNRFSGSLIPVQLDFQYMLDEYEEDYNEERKERLVARTHKEFSGRKDRLKREFDEAKEEMGEVTKDDRLNPRMAKKVKRMEVNFKIADYMLNSHIAEGSQPTVESEKRKWKLEYEKVRQWIENEAYPVLLSTAPEYRVDKGELDFLIENPTRGSIELLKQHRQVTALYEDKDNMPEIHFILRKGEQLPTSYSDALKMIKRLEQQQ